MLSVVSNFIYQQLCAVNMVTCFPYVANAYRDLCGMGVGSSEAQAKLSEVTHTAKLSHNYCMYICICDGQASMTSGVFVVVTVWMDNTIYP